LKGVNIRIAHKQGADSINSRLLRERREWPRGSGTADECDEFPSSHGFARAEDYIGYEKNITSFGSRIVPLATSKRTSAMSAWDQKRTRSNFRSFALSLKGDIARQPREVRARQEQ
jgi:hypothetical protein